jgi:hypothetical protein
MQRALAALGAELPLKFVGLRVCVEANLKMIEELGGATELSDELVSWWRRLDWLREEYLATLRYDRDVVHEDYEAERSQKLNGWRKLFVERAVNGVPRGWLESSRAPKTPIAHFEILAPVRLLGAEMFMLCHRIEARGRGHGPEQVDFARFLNHVSIHRQAFLELEKTGTTSFDLTGAIHDLTDLQNAAQRWSDGKISYDDFCYQGWDANQRLSARTTLVDVPQARELGLSLLEFNTEYSGLCRGLIPLVEKIDRALLIDPSLNRPQNGLGATCPPDIAEAVLRSFGCRVFLLQLGMETVGYYIFAPNPPKTVIPTESLFQDLARHGLIKDPGHTRYGFFHGVAITEAARATLRNAGIRGYRLLDYQMAQTALYEGCQTLVCTVRAGPNRNLAKKQHLDVGWQETGYEVTRRMPGASPLEVLLRDAATGINLPQGAIPPRQMFDLRDLPRLQLSLIMMQRSAAGNLLPKLATA